MFSLALYTLSLFSPPPLSVRKDSTSTPIATPSPIGTCPPTLWIWSSAKAGSIAIKGMRFERTWSLRTLPLWLKQLMGIPGMRSSRRVIKSIAPQAVGLCPIGFSLKKTVLPSSAVCCHCRFRESNIIFRHSRNHWPSIAWSSDRPARRT